MQRNFLPILPFFKTPENTDSLPPDFGNGQHQGWS